MRYGSFVRTVICALASVLWPSDTVGSEKTRSSVITPVTREELKKILEAHEVWLKVGRKDDSREKKKVAGQY